MISQLPLNINFLFSLLLYVYISLSLSSNKIAVFKTVITKKLDCFNDMSSDVLTKISSFTGVMTQVELLRHNGR